MMIDSRLRVLVLFCVCAVAALAQANPGSVTGAVTGPEGEIYTAAFVSITNTVTGDASGAQGAADGRYTFASVAPGSYDLSVMVPGMKPHRRSGIAVAAGETVWIDVRLEYGPSLGTAGEDPNAIAALFIHRSPPPDGPAPRGSDGKPDLSGVWIGAPAVLPKLEMLPWAEALTAERTANHSKDHPMAYCLPSGPAPLVWPGWFEIVHTPSRLVMLLEDTPGYREVYLDGRDHPKQFGPTWLGHSTGVWEGDTLVIDTIGFHGQGWIGLSGEPHTERLRLTQKIRRPDLGHLQIEIAIDDPGAYREPWTVTKTATLTPEEEILEYICTENNKDAEHMVGR